MNYRYLDGQLHQVNGIYTPTMPNTKQNLQKPNLNNFETILEQEIQPKHNITISKHAERRLQERNVHLTEEQLQRIDNAVQNAKEKGCRESAIFLDDVALITSITNETVITVMDTKQETNEEIILTNIDSVVVI